MSGGLSPPSELPPGFLRTSSRLEDPRFPRHCLYGVNMLIKPPPEPTLSPSGPYWVTPHHLGGPQGGVDPNVEGLRPPLRAPSVAPLGSFWSPRIGTEIGTASGASFESTPRRPWTGRGAPEQVNYRVNSMSSISLLVSSGGAPRPLLESQLPPLGTLLGPLDGLDPRCRNQRPLGGVEGPTVPRLGATVYH